MNKALIITSGWILIGCKQNGQPQTELQIEYLRAKVQTSLEQLIRLNNETGNTPAGKNFTNIGPKTTERVEQLVNSLNDGIQIDLTSAINEIIKGTFYGYDTIELNTGFLKQSLMNYEQSKDIQSLQISLLLFNIEVIEEYYDLYMSYNYHFDIIKPIAVLNSYKVKKGQYFEGFAKTVAKQSGLSFVYELSDPQTKDGFVELPRSYKWNYDGKIRIKALTPGKHIVKLRASHFQNGKAVTFEDELEVEVTE